MPDHYPFSALVGQDDLKTVLILNAIYPAIGGVLIRGEKGTAKSTAARALAYLLPQIRAVANDPYNRPPDADDRYPDAVVSDGDIVEKPIPFVELPIGATEDRVLGSLDFKAALQTGERVFHPGLLAAANRGILYIDEVNLLPAHLVDVLLDAAAMGVNTIQREGITLSHPAQFMLIGTMNPEEGDLRPQLLDRFGLMIDVVAPRDPILRADVVQRRIAFEADSQAFFAEWMDAEQDLRQRITSAIQRLDHVVVKEEMLHLMTRICASLDVDGLRADIALHKTARALAAWEARDTVTEADVRRVAPWVLTHRQRRQPFQSPTLDDKQLDDIINQADDLPSDEFDTDTNDTDDPPSDEQESDNEMQTFTASKPQQIKQLRLQKKVNTSGNLGRRNPVEGADRGHYTRARQDSQPTDIALDATLRSAATNGRDENQQAIIHDENLHQKIRSSTSDTIILFVVDASGSMAARQRMEAVKGAVLALLTDAYQQRDHVGVIAFRGTHAELILSPTHSVERAEKQLARLPTGGRTPLAHALQLTHETVYRIQREQPEQPILVVMLSDGKANVALSGTEGDAWTQTQAMAQQLAQLGLPILFLDTETGYVRIGRGTELAELLHAEYMALDELSTDTLIHTIRTQLH
ncbi:MAG: magnesium chelatase subunit D family protein [Chloroflexota bacterium]